ncbi:uncharacterized protein LOC129732456 [Wyeomyia smithii]|uniref:uncharacterized protein LOC129732456 n=1 Tax=Wyeomyia smithii TaxID=174621 RepID=UPI002467DA34|nr:uncharacterized protein LOC129732456 [Wyeomyia smithii]
MRLSKAIFASYSSVVLLILEIVDCIQSSEAANGLNFYGYPQSNFYANSWDWQSNYWPQSAARRYYDVPFKTGIGQQFNGLPGTKSAGWDYGWKYNAQKSVPVGYGYGDAGYQYYPVYSRQSAWMDYPADYRYDNFFYPSGSRFPHNGFPDSSRRRNYMQNGYWNYWNRADNDGAWKNKQPVTTTTTTTTTIRPTTTRKSRLFVPNVWG